MPDAAAQWQTEVLYLLSELEGGTLCKLETLAAAVPDGADVFPAFAAVLERMQVASAADPIAAARDDYGNRVGNRIDRVGRVGAELVARLLVKANALIDAGANCPADPIVRARDFANLGVDAFGRRVGYLRGLTEAARNALRGIEPVTIGRESGYILGPVKASYYRKSTVARFTNAEATRQSEQLAEAERIRAAERAVWERRAANDPSVLAARVRELETKLAAKSK